MAMKLAVKVLLHDCQTQIGYFDAIAWNDYAHKAGVIKLSTMWYSRLRILLNDETYRTYWDKYGYPTDGYVKHEFPQQDDPVVEFEYSHADWEEDYELWCEVIAPNMLEIEMRKSNECHKFTYCGSFTVSWMGE